MPVLCLRQLQHQDLRSDVPDGDLHVLAPRGQEAGVRRPGQAPDARSAPEVGGLLEVLVHEERGEDAVLASNSKELPRRREGSGMNNVVEKDGTEVLALVPVRRATPDHGLHVVLITDLLRHQPVHVVCATAPGQHAPVRRERHAVDVAVVAEVGDLLHVRHGDQHDPLGRGAHGQQLAGRGGQRQGQDGAVDDRGARLRLSAGVPDGDGGLHVAGCHVLAAGGVGHGCDGVVHLHLHAPGLRQHVPEHHRGILAACDEAGAVRAEGEGHDLVLVL
mmetsp:Transcript_109230/g.341735  ORF Transcript_109230/g.341735 Transcript_109230/m.341735 type:complete len:276 (-) Transcript_109230:37-864(-)